MTPGVDWSLLTPHFVLAVFAIVVLMIRAARGRSAAPDPFAAIVSVVGCAATLALLSTSAAEGKVGLVCMDPYIRFFSALFVAGALVVSLASIEKGYPGEFHCLLLLSTLGMVFMVSACSLLMLFLGLELATICLFVLAGFHKADKRACEAAVKFLIVGAVASALLIFGASWLYGAAGSTEFGALKALFEGDVPEYAWFGTVLVLAGFAFKIAAVPFHLWAPDVYEGAPSLVVAFLSTASKAAALVALIRVLIGPLESAHPSWLGILSTLAVLTMVIGNLVAVLQTNVKRLLAYSGVAQAGFLLIAVAATAESQARPMAIMSLGLYLLLYLFSNAGAFLCVRAVSEEVGDHHLNSYDGLYRRNAPLAFSLLIFLLSLAGVPPLAGFVGKWYLFTAGVQGKLWWLVLLGALAGTVSLYYYLIVAKRMYIHEPMDGAGPIRVPASLAISIGTCVAITVLIGIYPDPWLRLAQLIARAL